MRVLMATECLRTGGAQVFALRLAKALHDKGHQVYFFYHYQDYIRNSLVKKVYPEANLIFPNIPTSLDWFIRKIDRILYKLSIDISIRHKFVINYIKRVSEKYQIEVVHSNMFQSDYVLAKALQSVKVPLVVTMHGSYESFLNKYLKKESEGYLNYIKKLNLTLSRVNAVAYLTDKNLTVFNYPGLVDNRVYDHIQFQKIYNGFQGRFQNPLKNEDLNIPSDHVVFGLVARGIPEKGWEIAIKAFIRLNHPQTSLVLVGHSEYVNSLKKKYAEVSNLIFFGESDNPLDVINAFDIGLLPSYYGESLPNVIVEYLYCGKPVITTNVGESGKMITNDNGEVAGFIIDEHDPIRIQHELNSHMHQILLNPILIKKKISLTQECFLRFDIDKCVSKYQELYQNQLETQS